MTMPAAQSEAGGPTISQGISYGYPDWLLSVLEVVRDGIIVIDEQGTIVYANPSYTRILGVKLQKILGKKLQDVEPGARLLEVLETGRGFVEERVRIKTLGVDCIITEAPIIREGKIVGAVAVFKDISEVIKLSEELQRAKDLVAYLQGELELKSNHLPDGFKSIVGKNGKFLEALSLAARTASSSCTVLIRGESGVGKELLAKAIHNASGRKSAPFIVVNCAAIPESLLESELFGYEEGAFTGAKRGGKRGKFELADKGTLFLDEVGDMSLSVQAKLLRAIQEREIERVGGDHPIKVDVRIIAATNKNLEEMVQERSFREDLFYRLNVVSVFLPPLRERRDDIPLLADYFVRFYSRAYGVEKKLASDVVDLLQAHSWPGNVRELQNVIEHSVVVSSGEIVTMADLPPHLRRLKPSSSLTVNGSPGRLDDLLAHIEKNAILAALRASKNNKTKAMKILGISRRTFYKKLKQYDIAMM